MNSFPFRGVMNLTVAHGALKINQKYVSIILPKEVFVWEVPDLPQQPMNVKYVHSITHDVCEEGTIRANYGFALPEDGRDQTHHGVDGFHMGTIICTSRNPSFNCLIARHPIYYKVFVQGCASNPMWFTPQGVEYEIVESGAMLGWANRMGSPSKPDDLAEKDVISQIKATKNKLAIL